MKKRKFEIDNKEFDSNEEIQFYLYLKELNKAGFCDFKTHIDPIVLCPSQRLGKKNKVIFRELTYKPDFEITWKKKAKGIFYVDREEYSGTETFIGQKGYVDVKGSFAGQRNASAISFPIKQKILYTFFDTYVAKVIPSELFQETFLPRELVFTKTGKVKTWKFSPRSLNEFLDGRRNT
jgi:hypothetical protein